jgi:hypothetical protein
MVKEDYGRGYNSYALSRFDDITAVLVAIYYKYAKIPKYQNTKIPKYQNMNFKLLSMCFTFSTISACYVSLRP